MQVCDPVMFVSANSLSQNVASSQGGIWDIYYYYYYFVLPCFSCSVAHNTILSWLTSLSLFFFGCCVCQFIQFLKLLRSTIFISQFPETTISSQLHIHHRIIFIQVLGLTTNDQVVWTSQTVSGQKTVCKNCLDRKTSWVSVLSSWSQDVYTGFLPDLMFIQVSFLTFCSIKLDKMPYQEREQCHWHECEQISQEHKFYTGTPPMLF
jgi:hypothetical protein